MPRKGKGQKIQTPTGQAYGEASTQEDAQRTIPLPKIEDVARSVVPQPGQAPFARPTERPSEPVTTRPGPGASSLPETVIDPKRRFRAAMMLPILEQMASQEMASPYLRNTVRKLKSYVGNPADFASNNPEPGVTDGTP